MSVMKSCGAWALGVGSNVGLSVIKRAAWVDEFRGRPRRCARERLKRVIRKARNWEFRPVYAAKVEYVDYLVSDAGRGWVSSRDGLRWAIDLYLGAGRVEEIRQGYERKGEGLSHGDAVAVALSFLGGSRRAEGHDMELCGLYLCECGCAACVDAGVGACRSGVWADERVEIFSEWVKYESEWCCGEAWGEGLNGPVRLLSLHPQHLRLPPLSDELKAALKREAVRSRMNPKIADR